MNKIFVWLTGLAAPLWRTLGANPKALKLILDAKLKIDDRGGYAFAQNMSQGSGMQIFIYFIMVIFGAMLIALPALMVHQPSAMGLVFSVWFVYMGFLLITEMSENMFDLRDLQLLLTKPINDLTFSLSRGLHVLVFTSKLALCLGIGIFIYLTFFRNPLLALSFTITGILAALLTMSATLALYLLLLRKVESSKLRKVIGWVQIVLGVFFFVSYQIPQFIDLGENSFLDFRIVDTPVGYSFPGLWLGAFWGAISGYAMGVHGYIQAILGAGSVVAGVWFYISQSKGYGEKLMNLRLSSTTASPKIKTSLPAGARQAGAGGTQPSKTLDLPSFPGQSSSVDHPSIEVSWYPRTLSNLFTRPGVERASFLFHWRMMSRDMGFKQRTYPSMVLMPVFFVIFFFRDGNIDELGSTEAGIVPGLLLLYFFAISIITPMLQVKVSDTPKAAWIFYNLPQGRSKSFDYGQFTAIFGRLFIPFAIVIYPATLFMFPALRIWDILLVAVNLVLLGLLIQSMLKDAPFSMSKETAQGNAIGPSFVAMFTAVLLGFLHWILSGFPIATVVGSLFMTAILVGVLYDMRRNPSSA
ncbi:MAG: hypothetical protein AAF741_19720 [Bacteroidota bacterium]